MSDRRTDPVAEVDRPLPDHGLGRAVALGRVGGQVDQEVDGLVAGDIGDAEHPARGNDARTRGAGGHHGVGQDLAGHAGGHVGTEVRATRSARLLR